MLLVNFNPFPVINTERLLLRRVEKSDVDEIFFLRSDKNVLQYLDRPPAANNDEALAWIEKIIELGENNESILWAITLKPDDTLVGTICFWNLQKENYRSEIGYALHTAQQGKGIMHEAMIAILDYGFKIMKLHSVEANVNPKNLPSIKLLERNNFIREAYFKENYFYDGKFLDSAIYSLIDPENSNQNNSR